MSNQELLNKILEAGYVIGPAMKKNILKADEKTALRYALRYEIIDPRSEEEKELVDVQAPRLLVLRRQLNELAMMSESHDLMASFSGAEAVDNEADMLHIRKEIEAVERRICELCGPDYRRAEGFIKNSYRL